jgi:hypothetical protein
MSNAFSSMQYPHWLIVAGAVLLVLGFIGLAFRQRGADPPKLGETASGTEEGLPKPEDELALTQADIRKANLTQQAKERWAKEGGDEVQDRA